MYLDYVHDLWVFMRTSLTVPHLMSFLSYPGNVSNHLQKQKFEHALYKSWSYLPVHSSTRQVYIKKYCSET